MKMLNEPVASFQQIMQWRMQGESPARLKSAEQAQGACEGSYLGKAQRLVSRYSDKLFWQVSSCSLSMRKLSRRPSTLQASSTFGFFAVSCMIFFQDLSMPSKRLASCVGQPKIRHRSLHGIQDRRDTPYDRHFLPDNLSLPSACHSVPLHTQSSLSLTQSILMQVEIHDAAFHLLQWFQRQVGICNGCVAPAAADA